MNNAPVTKTMRTPKGEEMVIANMPLVKSVAVRLRRRVPAYMDFDEMVQVGMIGLIEASRAFDPDLGIEFKHYAVARIRGAMLDEVRRSSPLSRSAVTFKRQENELSHRLFATLGRLPTGAEMVESSGRKSEAFYKEQAGAHQSQMCSMEEVHEEVMRVAGDRCWEPEVATERQELLTGLRAAIAALTEREQRAIYLYHVEGLKLKEVGHDMGVSESRISQMLAGIAHKLRHSKFLVSAL